MNSCRKISVQISSKFCSFGSNNNKQNIFCSYIGAVTQSYDLPEAKTLFLLRRAYRSANQRVVREDVKTAFKISDRSATTALRTVELNYPSLVERAGHKIVWSKGAQPPRYVGEVDLVEQLMQGRVDLPDTGLYPDELPFFDATQRRPTPRDPACLTEIFQATMRERPLFIWYVGMRRGQTAVRRRILPLGLEKVDDQMRLIAQDIEHEDHPVRSFVLTRIVRTLVDNDRLPRKLLRQSRLDAQRQVTVKFNPGLTPDQRDVLAHEFAVRDGKVTMLERAVHEFKIQHAGHAVSSSLVLPVFSIQE